MRNDRRDICPQMTRKKSLNESAYFYSAGVTALSMQCKPNKSVVLFSSMHAGPGTDRDGKPEILDFYNHNKCGVDIVDQMTRIYSTKSASRRWPVAVWCNMLDIAAINGWVIFKKCTNSNVSRRDFVFKLVTQLCHPRTGTVSDTPTSVEGLPQPVSLKRRHCAIDFCSNTANITCSFCDKPTCGKCLTECQKFTIAKCKNCTA